LEQLARSDYPYYMDEFDDYNLSIPGAKKDSLQWNLYYNWLQTTLLQVLLSSFGEIDSSIFDTHDLSSEANYSRGSTVNKVSQHQEC